MYLPNLMIVAGTGTKSGKTSFICKTLEQSARIDICGIKITPHFHEPTPGLIEIAAGNGYVIYEETNPGTGKDTSRMLNAGAVRVYLVQVWDSEISKVFIQVLDKIPQGSPIICESPALRSYFEPGLFVIMSSDPINKQKNINNFLKLPHLSFTMEELLKNQRLPVEFRDRKWHQVNEV